MAESSKGIVLSIDIGGTYTPITNVQDMNINFGDREIIRFEAHDLDLEGVITGIRRGAEITGTFIWIETDAAQLAVEAAFDSAALTPFQIAFPGANAFTYQFSGYIASYNPTGAVNGVKTIDFSLQITSTITQGVETAIEKV